MQKLTYEDPQKAVSGTAASQANRLETALFEGYPRGECRFLFACVDFTRATHDDPALDLSTLEGDGYIATLEAPNLVADARYFGVGLGRGRE